MKIVKFYKPKERIFGHDVILELYYNTANKTVDGGALTGDGENLLNELRTSEYTVNNKTYSFDNPIEYLENAHLAFTNPSKIVASQYISQKSKLDQQ